MIEFTHYVLTRFNTQEINGELLYDKPGADEWMDKRMVFFEKTKESVLSQTVPFRWIISLDKRTPDKYYRQIFTDERMTAVSCDIRDSFDYITPVTLWVITSRMDCDDIYNADALYSIQQEFEPRIKVIDLYYNQLVLETGEQYTNGNLERGEMYRYANNGPFLSLVEPSDRVMTCFCRPHSVLGLGYPFEDGYKEIPTCKVFKKYKGKAYPFAFMVIHDHNVANKITGFKVIR